MARQTDDSELTELGLSAVPISKAYQQADLPKSRRRGRGATHLITHTCVQTACTKMHTLNALPEFVLTVHLNLRTGG